VIRLGVGLDKDLAFFMMRKLEQVTRGMNSGTDGDDSAPIELELSKSPSIRDFCSVSVSH